MKHRTFIRVLCSGSLAVAAAIAMTCGGGDEEPANSHTAATVATMATSEPSPTASPTVVSPTATATPEEEVLAGYADYWEVYRDALRNRDTSHLEEVMTGARLERALREVQTLIEQGQAVEIVVNSQPVVIQVNGDTALLLDSYENQSHYIDLVTKQPLQATPVAGAMLRDQVTLQRVGDVWKVAEAAREAQ